MIKERSPIIAIGVAGGGANLDTASIAFHHIGSQFDAREIDYFRVHGLSGTPNGEQRVTPASEQVEAISQIIDSYDPKARILLVAQCLGTIAALTALEKYQDERTITLTTFSPPLDSPLQTILRPKSREKRSENDTVMRILDFEPGRVGDFSALRESSAHIPQQYFEDIRDAYDLEPRLRQMTAIGQAAVFGTSHDWNTSSPETVLRWRAQQSSTSDKISARALVIEDAGHSLNSSLSGITREQKQDIQSQNCARVVTVGLELLDQTA